MFYQKKLDAAMDWLKNKNKSQDKKEDKDINNEEYYDPKAEWEAENHMKLEGKDIFALIISALLVFGPLLLILILILIWVY